MEIVLLVPRGGIEPPTQGFSFSLDCSKDWTISSSWSYDREAGGCLPVYCWDSLASLYTFQET